MTVITIGVAGDITTATTIPYTGTITTSLRGTALNVPKLVLNDAASAGGWWVTRWSGWHNPTKATEFAPLAARHGSALGSGWLNGRVVTIEGLVRVTSDLDRSQKEQWLADLQLAGTDTTNPEPLWLLVEEVGVQPLFVAGVIGELSVTQHAAHMSFVIEFWAPFPLKMRMGAVSSTAVPTTPSSTNAGGAGARWWLVAVAAGAATTVHVWSQYTAPNTNSLGSNLVITTTSAVVVDLWSHLARVGGGDPLWWQPGVFAASWRGRSSGWSWQVSGSRSVSLVSREVVP